jgi:3-hydroxyisobutyrate dehydrogenase-like beta-hydroxyacid dehydrogenase
MIALLHPGAMGAAVGAELVSAGNDVAWCSAGRSIASRCRAEAAGLRDLHSLERVTDACAVVISVCPPHGALSLAASLGGFRGVFVDANAVSPSTSAAVGATILRQGGRYVDASIIGPPPAKAGRTQLYLSGAEAPQIAALFAGTKVEARVLAGAPGSASALKMAYAAWTKGSGALLLALCAMADHFAVGNDLREEWDRSVPGLTARADAMVAASADKAWRWVFEMTEVADSLQEADVPRAFGDAAAAVYQRIASAQRPAP